MILRMVYIVFRSAPIYRIDADKVRIERILHGARNLTALFDKEET